MFNNFNGNQSNTGQNTQIGNIMVEYINLMPDNNQSYSFPSDTLKEPVGNTFDMNHYVNEIPQGYHFVKILGGSSVKYFRDNPQVVVIGIAPNQPTNNYNPQPQQNNVPTMSTMYITYKNIDGKYLNGTTVKAQTGSAFNVRPYTQMLPMGYRFAYTKNVPSRYANGTHVVIVVKPLDYQQPQNHVNQSRPQNNQANVQRSNAVKQQALQQQRAKQAAQQRQLQQQRANQLARQRQAQQQRDQARRTQQAQGQRQAQASKAAQQSQQNDNPFNGMFDQQRTDPTVNGGYQNNNANQSQNQAQNSMVERKAESLRDDEDDRELDAIGSILATIGKGLSQLGYALKHRHHRQ